MFELHITPKKEYIEEFNIICNKLNFKRISHINYDMYGTALYLEEMIAEKCKNMAEVNFKINTLLYHFNKDNILRIKVESKIEEDYTYIKPYVEGASYFEVHIDILSEITSKITDICQLYQCAISKNPNKECYMLTYRVEDKTEYINNIKVLNKALVDNNIKYVRVIKEYCFHDDNIAVDTPWVSTYNFKQN